MLQVCLAIAALNSAACHQICSPLFLGSCNRGKGATQLVITSFVCTFVINYSGGKDCSLTTSKVARLGWTTMGVCVLLADS